MSQQQGDKAGRPCTLERRVAELVKKHGGLRAAARVTGIERSYFYRLATKQNDNPSAKVLRALGLKRQVIYLRTNPCKT